MRKVKNKLQVCHYAQVPCKPFIVNVADEVEAKKMIDLLAKQHLFLLEQKIISDYTNVLYVRMWDDDIDEDEDGEKWSNYWNEEEGMDWDEFEEEYL